MTQQEILVKIALNGWYAQVKRAAAVFGNLTDEQLMAEISPGRNRGIYLLGHLIVTNDSIFPIFGLHDSLYPELQQAFVQQPDKSGFEMPEISVLRARWEEVHAKLETAFTSFSTEDWLSRHNLMTDEDLANDPARNKLSVLMNRTAHIAYHLGQAALLQTR